MKYIDLTQTFTAEMPVYPGDTKPELKEISTVAKDGFGHFWVSTGMHVGTHIDAPLHFIKGGKRLSEFPVEKFIGRGVLIDAPEPGRSEIGIDLLKNIRIGAGDIVLVHSDISTWYREPEYYSCYPVFTEEFAKEIVKRGVNMVGLDFCSPDNLPYAIHKILLGAEILIIENMTNLDKLVGVKEFEVIALPAKFDTEAAPARVVARIA